jgi:hypothetical protein
VWCAQAHLSPVGNVACMAPQFSQLAQVAPAPYAAGEGAATPPVPSDRGSGAPDEAAQEESSLLFQDTPRRIVPLKEHRRKLACTAVFFTGCGITTGAVVIMLLLMSLQATSCPRDAATEYAEIATGEPCEEQVEQTTFVLVQPFERRHETKRHNPAALFTSGSPLPSATRYMIPAYSDAWC